MNNKRVVGAAHVFAARFQALLQLLIGQHQLLGQHVDAFLSILHAQGVANFGEQLARLKRLGNVVVGAARQRLGQVVLIAAAGDDNDFQMRVGRTLAETATHLITIHVRQTQIEQDQIERTALGSGGHRRRQGRSTVLDLDAIDVQRLQNDTVQHAHVRFVVHDQGATAAAVGAATVRERTSRIRPLPNGRGSDRRRFLGQEGRQRVHNGQRRGRTMQRIAVHHLDDEVVELLRCLGAQAAQPSRRLLLQSAQGGADVADDRIGRLAGQQPKHRGAQAINVGLLANRRRIETLLRRHEFQTAQQSARIGQAAAKLPSQAEIDQFRLPRRSQQDVGRLDVAVDQMTIVSRLQTAGRLMDVLARRRHVARPILQDVTLQVAALDLFHHQINQRRQTLIGGHHFAGVESHDDVSVTQLGQDAHLGVKTLFHRGRTILIDRQHLDGDAAFHQTVFGEEHHAHAAAAQRIEDAIIAQHQAVRRTRQHTIQLISRQQTRLHQRLADLRAAGIFRQAILALAEKMIDQFGGHQSEMDDLIEEAACVGMQTGAETRLRRFG